MRAGTAKTWESWDLGFHQKNPKKTKTFSVKVNFIYNICTLFLKLLIVFVFALVYKLTQTLSWVTFKMKKKTNKKKTSPTLLLWFHVNKCKVLWNLLKIKKYLYKGKSSWIILVLFSYFLMTSGIGMIFLCPRCAPVEDLV